MLIEKIKTTKTIAHPAWEAQHVAARINLRQIVRILPSVCCLLEGMGWAWAKQTALELESVSNLAESYLGSRRATHEDTRIYIDKGVISFFLYRP